MRRLVHLLRTFWRQTSNFFHLLFQKPHRQSPVPRATSGMARDAMHVSRSGSYFRGPMEKAIAQELREGQQIKLHGDPASERPVAGYGGRAPVHRKKPSRLATAILVILTVVVILGFFATWTP